MIDILKELEGCRTIAISGHVRPDGDAVGSCAAMARFLSKAVPDARIDVFSESFNHSLMKNIPGAESFHQEKDEAGNYITPVDRYDAFLVLDCDSSRIGGASALCEGAGRIINIDHHASRGGGSAHVSFVVPHASSTCELVYEVIRAAEQNGNSYLDAETAQAIYTGMVTDTGVFRYSNVSPRTMEIAADLIRFGFDFPTICREVFFEKTYVQQQIMGRALLESIRILDGQCIFCVIEKKTMAFYGATSVDLEGIASQLMLTEGVKAAVFLQEVEPLRFRVSLRTNGEVNAAQVCAFYGGGGHDRAAGCTISSTWRDAVNNLAESIEMQLKKTEAANETESQS